MGEKEQGFLFIHEYQLSEPQFFNKPAGLSVDISLCTEDFFTLHGFYEDFREIKALWREISLTTQGQNLKKYFWMGDCITELIFNQNLYADAATGF